MAPKTPRIARVSGGFVVLNSHGDAATKVVPLKTAKAIGGWLYGSAFVTQEVEAMKKMKSKKKRKKGKKKGMKK